MLKNHVFGSLNLNNSEIFKLSFEDIFLGTLDTYTEKMNLPSAVLGGVHGKVCWLIAYYELNILIEVDVPKDIKQFDMFLKLCHVPFHLKISPCLEHINVQFLVH